MKFKYLTKIILYPLAAILLNVNTYAIQKCLYEIDQYSKKTINLDVDNDQYKEKLTIKPWSQGDCSEFVLEDLVEGKKIAKNLSCISKVRIYKKGNIYILKLYPNLDFDEGVNESEIEKLTKKVVWTGKDFMNYSIKNINQ